MPIFHAHPRVISIYQHSDYYSDFCELHKLADIWDGSLQHKQL